MYWLPKVSLSLSMACGHSFHKHAESPDTTLSLQKLHVKSSELAKIFTQLFNIWWTDEKSAQGREGGVDHRLKKKGMGTMKQGEWQGEAEAHFHIEL